MALCHRDAAVAEALKRKDGLAVASAISAAAQQLVDTLPHGFLDPLYPAGSLNAGQVEKLHQLNECLREEYGMRRKMLIHRADCTLAALLTSSRTAAPATAAEAKRAIGPEREAMREDPVVTVADVFTTCKADLAALARKTSAVEERHAQATVKRVLIGAVPDRGGRAGEGRAPGQKGMHAFAPRKPDASPGSGRGGGRGARGGRGGRGGGDKATPQTAEKAPAPAAGGQAAAKPRVAWKPKGKGGTDAPPS